MDTKTIKILYPLGHTYEETWRPTVITCPKCATQGQVWRDTFEPTNCEDSPPLHLCLKCSHAFHYDEDDDDFHSTDQRLPQLRAAQPEKQATKDPLSPLRQHLLHVLRAAEGVIDWALDNGAHPGARAVHELVTETIFNLEVEEGERSPPAQPQTEGQQGSNDSLAQRVYLQGFDEIFGKPGK